MQFKDEQELLDFIIKKAKVEDWKAKLFRRNAEAIQVHSHGELFYKIDRLFPNEQIDSKRHRILSFESITEASFGRAANNINRIFKNSSYTVEASEGTLQELNKDQFEGKNFFAWFLDEWTKWALKEDPNARFVIYPPAYWEQGAPVVFLGSDFIKYMDDETFIFISEEESEIEYELIEKKVFDKVFYDQYINGPNVMESVENTFMPKLKYKIIRYVYHAFQAGVGFYRFEQNREDSKHYDVAFYANKQELLPVSDVGGQQDKSKINKSFLHPFVAFGNLALIQHSQHTAVNFTFSFPRMSEVETPCDAVGCIHGRVECRDNEATDPNFPGTKVCRACNGSGYRAPQTPYKIYRKKLDPQGMEGDEKALSYPMVEYYTPPTDILNYSKDEWKGYLEMAETASYIQQRVKTGNVEAAKSKEIDREDLYSFLSEVGKVYFSKIRFSSQCFENYLVGNPTMVTVNTPYSYAILSEGEAFTELQNILSSEVPVMIKANRVESFINKFVSQSSPIKKFLEVLKSVDLLLYYSKDELTAFKVGGVISPEQFAIHVFSYPVLQKMYGEDKTLFLKDTKEISAALLKELDNFKPQQPDLKTKFIPSNQDAINNKIAAGEAGIQDQPQT